jgi:hypothetical protein
MKSRRVHARLLTLLALYPALLTAQPDDWYRVELLVFRQGGAAAASQERWPPEPELAYPATQRFLVYPDRVEQRIAEHPEGSSEVDAFGRQIITLPDGESTPVPDIPRREPGGALTGPADPNAPAEGDETALPLPEPFVVRPASEREFAGKAAYMQRRGAYRILFHQTWLQPLAGRQQSVPLVLDDSGATGAYPELQGSIRLYQERYLQLDTNLWLNTEGSYLPGEWRMPPPPLGPASLVIEGPVSFDPLPAAVEADRIADSNAAGVLDPNAPEVEGEDGEPLYPYRHAVLLRQSRRMRNEEVHYLDHPMLGVVIKLTPLSPEELEELAPPAEAPPGAVSAAADQAGA